MRDGVFQITLDFRNRYDILALMSHEKTIDLLKKNGALWVSPVIKERDTCDCCILATKEASYLYNLEDGGLHYGQYSDDPEKNITSAKDRFKERSERIEKYSNKTCFP